MTNTLELSRGLFVFLSSPGTWTGANLRFQGPRGAQFTILIQSSQPNAARKTGPRHGTPLMTRKTAARDAASFCPHAPETSQKGPECTGCILSGKPPPPPPRRLQTEGKACRDYDREHFRLFSVTRVPGRRRRITSSNILGKLPTHRDL